MFLRYFILSVAIICSSCVFSPSRKEMAEVYYNLGNAYLRLGESENASSAFLRAVELDKKFASSNFNLAKSYMVAERYGDALEILDELLKEDEFNSIVLSAKAYCCYALGNSDQSFDIYQQILERNPDNDDARYNFAVLLALQGRDEEALAEFSRLMVGENESDSFELYYEMAKVSYNMKKWDDAIGYGEKAYELSPDTVELCEFLLKIYYEQKYYARYLEMADVYIDYNDKNVNASESPNKNIYFRKSVILLTSIGDFRQGADSLKKALALGFDDKDELSLLYDDPDLTDRDEIRKIIDRTNILQDYKTVRSSAGEEKQPVESESPQDSASAERSETETPQNDASVQAGEPSENDSGPQESRSADSVQD